MKPYYFLEPEKSLYGIYNPPLSSGWRDRGVVLCYPYGNEYIRAHPAFVRLTNMLNKAGFPVLRFDYYATGDSLGSDLDANITRWKEDIKCAINELQNMAGVPNITLVGLRLGATLAATIEGLKSSLSSIVLWDPVVCGVDYLEELNNMHQREFRDDKSINKRDELLGYPITNKFKECIAELDLNRINHLTSRKALLIVSSEPHEYSDLRNRLEEINIKLNYRFVNDEWSWDQLEGPMYMPVEILQNITNFISKELV